MQPFAQVEHAATLLKNAELTHIGFEHFALQGASLADAALNERLRRNFQGYTTDPTDALLRFGVSSIGKLPHSFVQNRTNIQNW
jgi:oxygen-independent coproporphyrinogen-3 oxidase